MYSFFCKYSTEKIITALRGFSFTAENANFLKVRLFCPYKLQDKVMFLGSMWDKTLYSHNNMFKL